MLRLGGMFVNSSEETVHCVSSFHLVVFSLLDSSLEFSLNVGHSSSGRCRNGGPLIQVLTSFGGTALIKTSAELTSDLMYLNVLLCLKSFLNLSNSHQDKRLESFEGLLIQANMVCASIQNTVLASDNSASSSGMDFSFSGATNAFTMSGTQK